uniref:hypothetical protein n=1 Tax=Acidovorax sp. SUPP3334 TaxID=2920881 RepID=UPI00295293EF|nr:hypothetical protein [Acidovorax sp. SUPP3334]
MAGFGALGKAGIDAGPWVSNGVPLALFVLAYQLGLRYSKKPWTYTAKLDRQLANYAPINSEAYRQLQERTKRVGSLESEFVLDWLEQERYAIELAARGRKPETKGLGFLDKKI